MKTKVPDPILGTKEKVQGLVKNALETYEKNMTENVRNDNSSKKMRDYIKKLKENK